MIYTALTRAVTQLVLIGQRSAIEARLRLSLRRVRTCAESASVFDGQYLREAEHLEVAEFWVIWQVFLLRDAPRNPWMPTENAMSLNSRLTGNCVNW